MDLQDAIDTQIGVTTNHLFHLVSFTILYYDYLLMFSVELERFWTPHWRNWGSILFFLNRYLTLLGYIPVIYESFWTESNPNPLRKVTICHLQLYHQSFVIVVQLSVGALLVLRTCALYEHSRRILVFLLVVGAVVISVACWAVYVSKHTYPVAHALPLIGCRKLSESSLGKRRRLAAAAWAGVMAFDILIFGMTVYKSLTTYRRVADQRLIDIMLHDGAAYFAIMVFLHLSVIFTSLFAPVYYRGISATFAGVMSSTLISRLVLRLRDPDLVRTDRRHDPGREHRSSSMATRTRDHLPLVSTFVALDTVEGQAWWEHSVGVESVGSVVVVSRER